jgi:hypothetical protein
MLPSRRQLTWFASLLSVLGVLGGWGWRAARANFVTKADFDAAKLEAVQEGARKDRDIAVAIASMQVTVNALVDEVRELRAEVEDRLPRKKR